MKNDQTLLFYKQNADSFFAGTVFADMEETRKRFTDYLSDHAAILDLGCGSGRDTRAFMDAGFRVDAMDGSEDMCARASEYTGIAVKHMAFDELEAIEQYDGIWACASLLHLPKNELASVLRRIENGLRENGVLYASFKYGGFEGMRDGRYFTDFTEVSLVKYWKDSSSLRIFDLWISEDVRADRKEKQWINLLARKM